MRHRCVACRLLAIGTGAPADNPEAERRDCSYRVVWAVSCGPRDRESASPIVSRLVTGLAARIGVHAWAVSVGVAPKAVELLRRSRQIDVDAGRGESLTSAERRGAAPLAPRGQTLSEERDLEERGLLREGRRDPGRVFMFITGRRPVTPSRPCAACWARRAPAFTPG
jgi:hypothetical protein